MITPHCGGGEFQTAQQEGDDRMAKSTTTMPEQVCISKTEYDRRMEERRAAGLLIDPTTAEIKWWYAQTLDPYGDGLPLLPQEKQVGREDQMAGPHKRVCLEPN